MLQRVVRILSEVVQPIAVVAAVDQVLPELPSNIIKTRDRQPDRGPLEGIARGLSALQGQVDAAYVTSCDVPLMETRFVQRMIDLLGSNEIVVPTDEQFPHPLAAVYRASVHPVVERLLANDRRRPVFLFDEVATQRVHVDQLRDVDSQLHTLMNLNHPEDYQAALRAAGLAASPNESG